MTEPQQPPAQPQPDLDPNLEPATLAQLASERRDLWPAIHAHPNCYPALRDWIAAQQAGGHNQQPATQQFSEQAKKAAGAKEFFDARVAPAAKITAKQAQRAYKEQTAKPGSPLAKATLHAPVILPVAAFLGIISLFLPVASHSRGGSIGFFSDEVGGMGVMYLLFFLATIAVSIAAVVLKAKWATIASGAVGVLAGLFAAVDGLVNIAMYANESRHSPGVGVFFLGLLGLVILTAAVLVLLSLRGTKGPAAPPPPVPPQY